MENNEKGKRRLITAKKSLKPLKKKANHAETPNTVSSNRLELLVTVVNRPKAEYYLDLIASFDVNMQLVALGEGTADQKMLELFGFTNSEKAVIFSVVQEAKIPDLLHSLEEKFAKLKNGKGIAYTIPLSSLIGTLIYGFLSNNRMAVKEEK